MKEISIKSEIAVFGAGPAGLSAAVCAARLGHDVLLIERNGFLGGTLGIGISPLSFLDSRGKRCVSGFAQEFMERLEKTGDCLGTDVCPKHNSVTGANAEGVRLLAIKLCMEEGVRVLQNVEPLQVNVENDRIGRVILYGKGNRITLEAKVFVDCTGDGDLAYLAGCSYEKGQEGSGTLQPPTMVYTLEGVDTGKLMDYVEKNPEELRYNDAAIYENPDYTSAHFRKHPSHVFVGLQKTFRQLKAEGKLPVERESFIYINGTHPGEVYINSTRLLNTDATDLFSMTKAQMDGLVQAHELTQLLKERIPGFENCWIASVSPFLGVRETRRFHGIRRVTGEDAMTGRVPEDSICLSGYKIDIHSGTDTGLLYTNLNMPFGIPYGCLVSSEIGNLMFAGRCISCDAIAYGSLRVIPTCMAMGQAAAAGAHLALASGSFPADADITALRRLLLNQDAILSPL